jgi:hypothetical protein
VNYHNGHIPCLPTPYHSQHDIKTPILLFFNVTQAIVRYKAQTKIVHIQSAAFSMAADKFYFNGSRVHKWFTKEPVDVRVDYIIYGNLPMELTSSE